jgi:hypothetical protein
MKLSFSLLNSLGNFLQVTAVATLVLNYPVNLLANTTQEISPNTVTPSVEFASLSGVVSQASVHKIDRSILLAEKPEEPPPPVPERPGGPRG